MIDTAVLGKNAAWRHREKKDTIKDLKMVTGGK